MEGNLLPPQYYFIDFFKMLNCGLVAKNAFKDHLLF